MTTRLERLTQIPIRKQIPIPGYDNWYLQCRQDESSYGILLTAMKQGDQIRNEIDLIELDFFLRKKEIMLNDYIPTAQKKVSEYLTVMNNLVSVIADIANKK